jgi:hypothetical protein
MSKRIHWFQWDKAKNASLIECRGEEITGIEVLVGDCQYSDSVTVRVDYFS